MTEDSAHWRADAKHRPVVERLKKSLAQHLHDVIDSTECFSHAYFAEELGGVCEFQDCPIRSYCKQSWQLSQIQTSQNAPTTEAFKRGIGSKSRARKLKVQRTNRGKYKDSTKFDRLGYVDQGRPVDQICSAFVRGIGEYQDAKRGWSSSDRHRDGVFLKRTASYHALIIGGAIVARLWTDTPRKGKIDVVAETVAHVREAAPHIEVTRIPDGSWQKTKPCTFRAVVTDPSDAETVASTVAKRMRQLV